MLLVPHLPGALLAASTLWNSPAGGEACILQSMLRSPMMSAAEHFSSYLPRTKCLGWPKKPFCICCAADQHRTRERICQVLTGNTAGWPMCGIEIVPHLAVKCFGFSNLFSFVVYFSDNQVISWQPSMDEHVEVACSDRGLGWVEPSALL